MTWEEHVLAVLGDVAAIPTAPFHEEAVARHLVGKLQTSGFTIQRDRFGNLLAHRRRGQEARPVALVAHMDHPGLGVSRVTARTVLAEVLGGVRPGVLAPGTALRFYDGGVACAGEVREYIPPAGGTRAGVRAEVDGDLSSNAFGVLAIPSLSYSNGLLAMRAADDLAQCACLLLLAERLVTVEGSFDVTFVLTRAEETGLLGATLVAQAGLVPRDAVVVSLECSRALPGAELGKGPVIRVGDARQSFDPRGEALLLAARDELMRQRAAHVAGPGGEVQRQLMSGGSCEASAFQAFGYMATGVVLPLANYHNADANGTAGPEYIHMNDLLGEVDFLVAVVAETSRPLLERPRRFTDVASQASQRLLDTDANWDIGVSSTLQETP